MNKKDYIKNVALASAIMADFVSASLFMQLFERIETPYLTGVYHISDWAIEFNNLHRNTNWNKIARTGMKPLSKYYQVIYSWEDSCGDYAYFKLDNFQQMRIVK